MDYKYFYILFIFLSIIAQIEAMQVGQVQSHAHASAKPLVRANSTGSMKFSGSNRSNKLNGIVRFSGNSSNKRFGPLKIAYQRTMSAKAMSENFQQWEGDENFDKRRIETENGPFIIRMATLEDAGEIYNLYIKAHKPVEKVMAKEVENENGDETKANKEEKNIEENEEAANEQAHKEEANEEEKSKEEAKDEAKVTEEHHHLANLDSIKELLKSGEPKKILVAVEEFTRSKPGLIQGYVLYQTAYNTIISQGRIVRIDDFYIWNDFNEKKITEELFLEVAKKGHGDLYPIQIPVPRANLNAMECVNGLPAEVKETSEIIWELPKEKFEHVLAQAKAYNHMFKAELTKTDWRLPDDIPKMLKLKKHEVLTVKLTKIDVEPEILIAKALYQEKLYSNWSGKYIWIEKFEVYLDFLKYDKNNVPKYENRLESTTMIMAKLIEKFQGENVQGIKWTGNIDMTRNFGHCFEQLGAINMNTKNNLVIYQWKPKENEIQGKEV